MTKLERLCTTVQRSSLCGLGQSAPNPVLSTLRYFHDEYEAHIREKRCPALVCVDLIRFAIDAEACKRCGLCSKVCPLDAITWQKKEVAVLHREKCIRCKSCIRACKFKAIH